MRDAGVTVDGREDYVPRRPRRHRKETGRLGLEIYEREIRRKVVPEHIGQIVAIDVDSGCWSLGSDITEARDRLEEERPEAVDVLLHRVGYNAVGSIGGGAPRRVD